MLKVDFKVTAWERRVIPDMYAEEVILAMTKGEVRTGEQVKKLLYKNYSYNIDEGEFGSVRPVSVEDNDGKATITAHRDGDGADDVEWDNLRGVLYYTEEKLTQPALSNIEKLTDKKRIALYRMSDKRPLGITSLLMDNIYDTEEALYNWLKDNGFKYLNYTLVKL